MDHNTPNMHVQVAPYDQHSPAPPRTLARRMQTHLTPHLIPSHRAQRFIEVELPQTNPPSDCPRKTVRVVTAWRNQRPIVGCSKSIAP